MRTKTKTMYLVATSKEPEGKLLRTANKELPDFKGIPLKVKEKKFEPFINNKNGKISD